MPSKTAMGLSSHLIRIHPDNAASKDCVILLEAGTIVGPSPERLRVARSTLDRKIVKKYNIWLQPEHFLFVEGYDPRIHAVYFCPQLYKHDSDKKACPSTGRGNRPFDRKRARRRNHREATVVRTGGEVARSANSQHSLAKGI